MTKEQEEAIEYVQEQIDYYKEQIKFIEAVDNDYYDEEYELYKNRVKQFETVLSMLKEKDRQIDLMAEHIAFNQKVNSYEDIKTYKEQIKQHYENQSKLFKYDYNKKSTLDINSNAKI